MASPTPRSRRPAVVATLLAVLPLLAIAGLLAPGAVEVLAQAAESESEASADTPARPHNPLERQPLLIPRDLSAGFTPELLDLEHMFARTSFMDEPLKRELARLLSFPRHHGDLIVLDDAGPALRKIAFRDALSDLVQSLGGALDPPPADLLPITFLPLGDGLHFDDLIVAGDGGNEPIPIPEPRTAVMVGLGLAVLARLRRLQRQPSVS